MKELAIFPVEVPALENERCLDWRWPDILQFTAPNRELGVANRDFATIERIYDGRVTAKLYGRDQVVTFHADRMRHFDYGDAVTFEARKAPLLA